MQDELQQKLFEKYPNLFENRHKSIQESCMAWGIECDDGWYDIIDNLCNEITQNENIAKDKIDYQPFKFDQVKEKFGGLRAYSSGGNDYTRGLKHMAEAMSYCICEHCGNKGRPNTSGWIATLCDNCRGTKQN